MVGIDELELDYSEALRQAQPLLSELQRDMLVALAAAPEHEMSAGQLARLLGLDHHVVLNREISRLARHLVRNAEIEPPQREDGSYRWWNVVAVGRYSDDGSRFYWKLRPQLVQAVQELGFLSSLDGLLADSDPLTEGALLGGKDNAFERNPIARKRCIEHYGVHCFICGFDFEQAYGTYGKGVIHVHHLNPLSAGRGEEREVDPVRDLRPICPNCHVVVHRRTPPFSIEEVKKMLEGEA